MDNFQFIRVNSLRKLNDVIPIISYFDCSRQREIIFGGGEAVIAVQSPTVTGVPLKFVGIAALKRSSLFSSLAFEFAGAFVAEDFRNKGIYLELTRRRIGICKTIAYSVQAHTFKLISSTKHNILIRQGWTGVGTFDGSLICMKHVNTFEKD